MLHKLPHVGRKVTPPQPTFMTDDQKSEYLASLRKNRPARPTGSRPAPFKSQASIDQHVIPRAESAMSLRGGGEDAGHVRFEEPRNIPGSQRALSHRHSMLSQRSVPSLRSTKGRPLVQAPSEGIPSARGRRLSPTTTVKHFNQTGETIYKESGTRWLERQEAHALRQALEVMDAKEEKRIHSSAQDEAADLVWQHQHPGQAKQEKVAGYRNPDLSKKRKSHLVGGAHDRSQSDGNIALSRVESKSKQFHMASEGSNNSQSADENAEDLPDKTRSKKKRLSDAMQQLRIASGQAIANVDTRTLRNFSGGRRRMSGQRNASNRFPTFPNSEDNIFEESEEMSMIREGNDVPNDQVKALTTSRNLVPHAARPVPQKAETMPNIPKARPNPFDRRRKQTEQIKVAPYMSNAATQPRTFDLANVPAKDGKEIRSDDIRAATSMKRSDRSPKLPTPTAVSDGAGRPIVSFDPAWKSPSDRKQEQQDIPTRPRPEPPAVTVSAPFVPHINLPGDKTPTVPTICLPDDDDPYDPPASLPETAAPGVPTFSFDGPEEQDDPPSTTALPTIVSPARPPPPTRPLPQHTQSMPVKPTSSNTTSKFPWLNRGAPTATCASCTLPISGRIVTASDASQQQKSRFHSECFTCAHCSTALECVAFYPEPENKRHERLEQHGLQSENDALRFYCHLDFHEFFSPRCRSCKTPIEGEVILAAGGEYHIGHFFCAECGNPFESNTPFVEKGGYAYCVACHRKRTSGRCRGCKALILDEGCVEALDGQWHDECFVCFECNGNFGDEGRFYLREVEVEVTAKERRRGTEKKFEKKPVCQRCEEMRLKQ